VVSLTEDEAERLGLFLRLGRGTRRLRDAVERLVAR
jgi:hypothetical protein